MNWYLCTVDNSYDGVVGYRKGQHYELPGTPPASFFSSVVAPSAVRVDDDEFHAQRDLNDVTHVYDDIDWEGDIEVSGSLNVSGDLSVQHIAFDTTHTHSPIEGELGWDTTEETLTLGMPGGSVNLQLGMEMYLPRRVENKTGGALSNGQLVYISGGSGNNAYVALAKADASATAVATIAMLTENIADNGKGYATTLGIVRGLNTNAYNAGTKLYLSAATAGAWTNTQPVHPYYSVCIGTVFRKHASEGSIIVHIEKPTVATCVAGGESYVWDDQQVGISNIRVPAVNAPTERLYAGGIGGGITFPYLGFGVNDYLYFDVQTSHAMLISSVLECHVHYTTPTNGTGNKFKFQLDVIASSIAGTFAVPTGSPFSAERSMDSDDSTTQRYFDVAEIPAVNSTVSTIYKCKLTRIAASGSEYAGEVYITGLDCHYKKDSLGSRNEMSKG